MKLQIESRPPIADLVAELEAMKQGLGQKGVRSMLVYGSKPVTKQMRDDAPVEEGSLRKAIGYRSLNKLQKANLNISPEMAALILGTTKKTVETLGNGVTKKRYQDYKAHWFEEGVAPHVIGGREATKKRAGDKVLKFGNSIYRKTVRHPGIKKRPFISTALDKAGSQMESRFYDGLVNYLERQRAKYNPVTA